MPSELTHGRWDGRVGAVVFPVVRALSRSLGNFRVARLLMLLGVLSCGGFATWFMPAPYGPIMLVLSGLIGLWFNHRYIRLWAGMNFDSDALPLLLLIELPTIAGSRLWLSFLTLIFTPLIAFNDGWLAVVTEDLFFALALYACTCIVPRRRSRLWARVKALRLSALTPTPAPA